MKDTSSLPVCIIGAGSSGVTAAKALREQGVAFDCYEVGSDIGGMWRYQNDNGMSSAYRSLHIDTSRRNLSYSDFPIPSHYPDFLSHFEVIRYLEDYANHFQVRQNIRFKTRVERVEREPGGTWRVTLDDGESKLYRAVLVANGHLWDPRWARFPGEFSGTSLHAHDYKTPEPFVGRNVLVVGIGNSAVDIAVDVCKQAKSTYISTRRSAWIMPKYIMGYPSDRWSSFLGSKLKLPTRVVRSVMKHLMGLAVGNQERFGVPRPQHAIWREHATLSQELLPYAGHGWIKIKPNVKQLRGSEVLFDDGTEAPIDTIIYATGYKTTFPFIDKKLFAVEDGKVDLYRRVLVPHAPGLYMVGLVQPIGPTIPLVEIQGQWVAHALSGRMRLPERNAMDKEIAAHQRELEKRYVGSARYTLEVDFREYAAQMRNDMRTGKAGV
ncbi:MAG: NAD(P)-binding domain-containing protein [Ottowia sp.]|uniref:flavin-containing monooxygenase n=1 Tax=Ottowia sp. TaxID=1898956 RepID=UPI003C755FD9